MVMQKAQVIEKDTTFKQNNSCLTC